MSKEDIIKAKFKSLESNKASPIPTRAPNKNRIQLHRRTLYYLSEARRAFGYAALRHMEKDKEQYLQWMENATFLLVEASACRECALQEPWRI